MTANDDSRGGSIKYYVSADRGSHWEAVSKGVLHSLAYPGNSLRWKAELSPTSEDTTPSIDSIRFVVPELYPANPALDVSNDHDNQWSYSGIFSGTENTTDFSEEIKQYLSGSPADMDGKVLVPLLIHSDSDGIIRLSRINITYEIGEERPPENQTIYIKIPKAADLTLANLDLSDPTGHAKNATLDVGGDGDLEWSRIGTLEGLERTPDLSREIEENLSRCAPDSEGNCLVPLVLGSGTSGNIKITNINVQYQVLDLTPPAINSLLVMPSPAQPGDILNIQVNATDNIKVESVNASLQGTTTILTYSEETGFYIGAINAPQPGNYTLSVFAIDPAGLASNKSSQILVKSVKPDLIVTPEGITHSPVKPREGDTVIINAVVQNMGDVKASNFYVKLLIDGVSRSTKLISIQPASYALVQFEWNAIYGDHEITVIADSTDFVSEYDETNNRATIPIFAADATPPTIGTITVEPAPSYSEDILTLKAEVSDNAGVGEVTINLLGETRPLAYNRTTDLYEGTIKAPSKPGSYTVTLLATDNNGLVSSSQVEITINPIGPDLTLTPAGISLNPSTASDGDTVTVDTRIYNIGGTNANNFEAELLIDGVSQGTKELSVMAGNSSAVQFEWKAVYGSHVFTVISDSRNIITEKNEANNIANKTVFVPDLKPPTIHEIGFIPASVSERDSFTIYAAVMENVGVYKVVATINRLEVSLIYNPDSGLYEGTTTAPAAGVYLANVSATDITGLTSSRQATVEIRRREPDLEISTTDVVILPLRVVENDPVVINATIHNRGGSSADNFDVTFSVDGTIEDVASISIEAGKAETLTFYWNAVYGKHSLTINVDPNDRIVEINESNNANSRTLFVSDVTPPEVTGLGSIPTSWSNSSVHDIQWKTSYDKNGIERYEYLIDYGQWISIGMATSFTTPALPDGVHTVYVRAVDKPGNVGPSSNVSIYIDTAPPNIPVIREWHTGKNWSQHDSPYISWSNPGDKGSGVNHYMVSVDNQTPLNIGNNLSYHQSLETGIHTLKIYAVDALEHASDWSNEVTVYIDTIKPSPPNVTSQTHPEDRWYPVNTPTFNLTAPWDHSGINGYYYLVDVFNSTTPDSLSRWTENSTIQVLERPGIWPLDQTPPIGLPDGIWYFHIASRDNSGNVGTNATHYMVKIDTYPPFINNMTPYEGEVVRIGTPLINATLIDGFSGVNVSAVVVRLDGEMVNASVSSNNVQYSPPQCLNDGNYTVIVEATDLADNTGTASRNFTILLPRVDAGAVESVDAVYNGAGELVKSNIRGKIVLINKEKFTIPSADFTLENINSTSLENQTIYVLGISPGENSVVNYTVNKTPILNMSLEWNSSLENRIHFDQIEDIDFRVMVGNPSSDELREVNVTFPLPQGISEVEVLGITPLTSGLEYDATGESFRWKGDILPSEVKELAFRLTVRASDDELIHNNTLNLDFNASANYGVNETFSGLTIGDVCRCMVIKETFHLTRASIQLKEDIPILIVSKDILAWTTDEANGEFINELDRFTSGALFTKVTSKEDFFSELRSGSYNVLFLANTDWREKLNESEVKEIKDVISAGGRVGTTLIMSGFSLKYVPELGEVLGDKYRGSLPMGERFEVKEVAITENHYITEGSVGQSLSSTGWAVRVDPEGSVPLAYFENVMSDNANGEPSSMKELPAITISSYGEGAGVLFSSDLGASVMEGLSKEMWINIVSRAIEWVPDVIRAKTVGLSIEKVVHPQVITAKLSHSEQDNEEEHANVEISIKNTGQLDLFGINVTEILPEGIVLANGTISQREDELKVDEMLYFNYSLRVVASDEKIYNLLTEVTAVDNSGNLHYFNKSLTLEVLLSPGTDMGNEKERKSEGSENLSRSGNAGNLSDDMDNGNGNGEKGNESDTKNGK